MKGRIYKKAHIWGTLTWVKPTQNAKQDFDKILKNLVKQIDTHIWSDIHEDIQMLRYKTEVVPFPDFHFILALDDARKLEDFKLNFELATLKHVPNCGISDLQIYKYGKRDKGYCFNTHEKYFDEVYCPHKTKCRRKGCPHKKELNKASILRT